MLSLTTGFSWESRWLCWIFGCCQELTLTCVLTSIVSWQPVQPALWRKTELPIYCRSAGMTSQQSFLQLGFAICGLLSKMSTMPTSWYIYHLLVDSSIRRLDPEATYSFIAAKDSPGVLPLLLRTVSFVAFCGINIWLRTDSYVHPSRRCHSGPWNGQRRYVPCIIALTNYWRKLSAWPDLGQCRFSGATRSFRTLSVCSFPFWRHLCQVAHSAGPQLGFSRSSLRSFIFSSHSI